MFYERKERLTEVEEQFAEAHVVNNQGDGLLKQAISEIKS